MPWDPQNNRGAPQMSWDPRPTGRGSTVFSGPGDPQGRRPLQMDLESSSGKPTQAEPVDSFRKPFDRPRRRTSNPYPRKSKKPFKKSNLSSPSPSPRSQVFEKASSVNSTPSSSFRDPSPLQTASFSSGGFFSPPSFSSFPSPTFSQPSTSFGAPPKPFAGAPVTSFKSSVFDSPSTSQPSLFSTSSPSQPSLFSSSTSSQPSTSFGAPTTYKSSVFDPPRNQSQPSSNLFGAPPKPIESAPKTFKSNVFGSLGSSQPSNSSFGAPKSNVFDSLGSSQPSNPSFGAPIKSFESAPKSQTYTSSVFKASTSSQPSTSSFAAPPKSLESAPKTFKSSVFNPQRTYQPPKNPSSTTQPPKNLSSTRPLKNPSYTTRPPKNPSSTTQAPKNLSSNIQPKTELFSQNYNKQEKTTKPEDENFTIFVGSSDNRIVRRAEDNVKSGNYHQEYQEDYDEDQGYQEDNDQEGYNESTGYQDYDDGTEYDGVYQYEEEEGKNEEWDQNEDEWEKNGEGGSEGEGDQEPPERVIEFKYKVNNDELNSGEDRKVLVSQAQERRKEEEERIRQQKEELTKRLKIAEERKRQRQEREDTENRKKDEGDQEDGVDLYDEGDQEEGIDLNEEIDSQDGESVQGQQDNDNGYEQQEQHNGNEEIGEEEEEIEVEKDVEENVKVVQSPPPFNGPPFQSPPFSGPSQSPSPFSGPSLQSPSPFNGPSFQDSPFNGPSFQDSPFPAPQSTSSLLFNSDADNCVVGTCLTMCSTEEMDLRQNSKQLHFFEIVPGTENTHLPLTNPKLAVKIYRRPEAETDDNKPPNLRPLHTLKMTFQYLINVILIDKRRQFFEVHNFIRDRTRSIRHDLRVQGLELCMDSIEMLEEMARWHILSDQLLCDQSQVNYDVDMNIEQLGKILATLKSCYKEHRRRRSNLKNEAEFTAYLILLLMKGDSFKFSLAIKDIPQNIFKSREVKLALSIAAAFHSRDYVKFFKYFEDADYLVGCILHMSFRKMRAIALTIMNKSYGTALKKGDRTENNKMSLAHFKKILKFDNIQEARELCVQHGIPVSGEDVLFKSQSFIWPKTEDDKDVIFARTQSALLRSKITSLSEIDAKALRDLVLLSPRERNPHQSDFYLSPTPKPIPIPMPVSKPMDPTPISQPSDPMHIAKRISPTQKSTETPSLFGVSATGFPSSFSIPPTQTETPNPFGVPSIPSKLMDPKQIAKQISPPRAATETLGPPSIPSMSFASIQPSHFLMGTVTEAPNPFGVPSIPPTTFNGTFQPPNSSMPPTVTPTETTNLFGVPSIPPTIFTGTFQPPESIPLTGTFKPIDPTLISLPNEPIKISKTISPTQEVTEKATEPWNYSPVVSIPSPVIPIPIELPSTSDFPKLPITAPATKSLVPDIPPALLSSSHLAEEPKKEKVQKHEAEHKQITELGQEREQLPMEPESFPPNPRYKLDNFYNMLWEPENLPEDIYPTLHMLNSQFPRDRDLFYKLTLFFSEFEQNDIENWIARKLSAGSSPKRSSENSYILSSYRTEIVSERDEYKRSLEICVKMILNPKQSANQQLGNDLKGSNGIVFFLRPQAEYESREAYWLKQKSYVEVAVQHLENLNASVPVVFFYLGECFSNQEELKALVGHYFQDLFSMKCIRACQFHPLYVKDLETSGRFLSQNLKWLVERSVVQPQFDIFKIRDVLDFQMRERMEDMFWELESREVLPTPEPQMFIQLFNETCKEILHSLFDPRISTVDWPAPEFSNTQLPPLNWNSKEQFEKVSTAFSALKLPDWDISYNIPTLFDACCDYIDSIIQNSPIRGGYSLLLSNTIPRMRVTRKKLLDQYTTNPDKAVYLWKFFGDVFTVIFHYGLDNLTCALSEIIGKHLYFLHQTRPDYSKRDQSCFAFRFDKLPHYVEAESGVVERREAKRRRLESSIEAATQSLTFSDFPNLLVSPSELPLSELSLYLLEQITVEKQAFQEINQTVLKHINMNVNLTNNCELPADWDYSAQREHSFKRNISQLLENERRTHNEFMKELRL